MPADEFRSGVEAAQRMCAGARLTNVNMYIRECLAIAVIKQSEKDRGYYLGLCEIAWDLARAQRGRAESADNAR